MADATSSWADAGGGRSRTAPAAANASMTKIFSKLGVFAIVIS
jgi:hypothetical protein